MFKKIEQFLFYFLLFAIPFQTRIIFWKQNWYFNEWQSASLYGTDLILGVLFLLWAWDSVRHGKIFNFQFSIFNKFSKSQFYKPDFWLIIFVVISAISIKNAISPQLAVYNWLKVSEFVLFYFYIKSYAVRRFDLIISLTAVVAGGAFQSIIAIIQFFKQSSLGLSWLGESVINPNLTGIAVFYNSIGVKIARAYGTTPHPNILAAYLFLAMFAFYAAYLYCHLYHSENSHHQKLNLFFLVSYPLILLAFFFSFARVALFLWFFTFAVRAPLVLLNKGFRKVFNEKANRARLTKILVIGTIVVLSFGVFYWQDVISRAKISSNDEAVQLRIFYNQESLKAVNWFGVGNGNFVNWLMARDPNLPRYVYQPVHNIYLLIYSENGILAAGAFVIFLGLLVYDFIKKTKMAKFYDYSFLLLFLSFLFMGLFDHFLWTLQQGRLMFWLLCGLLTLF